MSHDPKDRKFYTQKEKVLLISLVENYKNLIECKKTDAVSLRCKQEVWDNICLRYNSNDVTKRTSKQLRKLWDNMKQKTRKSDSERKNEVLKTGGDPPPENDNDPVHEKVRSIVPTLNFEVENPWDSISVFKKKKPELQKSTIDINGDNIRSGPSKSPLQGHCNVDNITKPLSVHNHRYNMDYNIDLDNNNIQQNSPEALTCLQDHNYEKDMLTRDMTMTSTKNITFKAPTNKKNKRNIAKRLNYIEEDSALRKRKLEESILQQKELHNKKMEVAEIEKKFWEAKTALL